MSVRMPLGWEEGFLLQFPEVAAEPRLACLQ